MKEQPETKKGEGHGGKSVFRYRISSGDKEGGVAEKKVTILIPTAEKK